MQLGDVITAITAAEDKRDGTVVYIHPERRYYILEFTGRLGKYREAFLIGQDSKIMGSGRRKKYE